MMLFSDVNEMICPNWMFCIVTQHTLQVHVKHKTQLPLWMCVISPGSGVSEYVNIVGAHPNDGLGSDFGDFFQPHSTAFFFIRLKAVCIIFSSAFFCVCNKVNLCTFYTSKQQKFPLLIEFSTSWFRKLYRILQKPLYVYNRAD